MNWNEDIWSQILKWLRVPRWAGRKGDRKIITREEVKAEGIARSIRSKIQRYWIRKGKKLIPASCVFPVWLIPHPEALLVSLPFSLRPCEVFSSVFLCSQIPIVKFVEKASGVPFDVSVGVDGRLLFSCSLTLHFKFDAEPAVQKRQNCIHPRTFSRRWHCFSSFFLSFFSVFVCCLSRWVFCLSFHLSTSLNSVRFMCCRWKRCSELHQLCAEAVSWSVSLTDSLCLFN